MIDLKTRVANDFKFHPAAPNSANAERHDTIRFNCLLLANLFLEQCPESRELSLALTSLEEAMMWANASIARNNG